MFVIFPLDSLLEPVKNCPPVANRKPFNHICPQSCPALPSALKSNTLPRATVSSTREGDADPSCAQGPPVESDLPAKPQVTGGGPRRSADAEVLLGLRPTSSKALKPRSKSFRPSDAKSAGFKGNLVKDLKDLKDPKDLKSLKNHPKDIKDFKELPPKVDSIRDSKDLKEQSKTVVNLRESKVIRCNSVHSKPLERKPTINRVVSLSAPKENVIKSVQEKKLHELVQPVKETNTNKVDFKIESKPLAKEVKEIKIYTKSSSKVDKKKETKSHICHVVNEDLQPDLFTLDVFASTLKRVEQGASPLTRGLDSHLLQSILPEFFDSEFTSNSKHLPFRLRSVSPIEKMASSEPSFKDLCHPSLNEQLKAYNAVTFKLIKTVSEFSGHLSRLHERHAEDLQVLVENYRKKHSDLRNERPACSNHMFQAWESLLQEVEVDSQVHSDVSGALLREVSRPLIEKTFHRKIQSRKLFTQRESIETILGKTEEMLKKCRREQTEAYQQHCREQSASTLAVYAAAHNAYVQQLCATNAMLHHYNTITQPLLLQELEEVHAEVDGIVVESVQQGTEVIAIKSQETSKRYDQLTTMCRNADPRSDISALVQHLEASAGHNKGIPQHRFIGPQPPGAEGSEETHVPDHQGPYPPPFRNELVTDPGGTPTAGSIKGAEGAVGGIARPRGEALRKEAMDLETQIAQLQEGMNALLKVQQRNLDSCLYHKANELQEDISMKRFDLRVNQVHLAAVKAQKELFASREGTSTECRDRKMSSASTGSMKSKWMKAFKSLKTTGSAATSGNSASGATAKEIEKKNGRGMESPTSMFETSHLLQENTYKKITACDACHQILRGHSRQGLKCRLCKANSHVECQDKLPRCQPKSKLLRRQRSTSEIEARQNEGEDEGEPVFSLNSLIASQPGRRMRDPSMRDPPSPSTPSSCTSQQFPLPPKGISPSNAGRTQTKDLPLRSTSIEPRT